MRVLLHMELAGHQGVMCCHTMLLVRVNNGFAHIEEPACRVVSVKKNGIPRADA